jgi:hypothetical protein
MIILYIFVIFPVLESCTQEKSGNPGWDQCLRTFLKGFSCLRKSSRIAIVGISSVDA